jgi:hypothetical protein
MNMMWLVVSKILATIVGDGVWFCQPGREEKETEKDNAETLRAVRIAERRRVFAGGWCSSEFAPAWRLDAEAGSR